MENEDSIQELTSTNNIPFYHTGIAYYHSPNTEAYYDYTEGDDHLVQ